ncbi:hypothetical protein C1645_812806 [Glomus cerebriforme]|uniref:Uncharacterized protein n=1 Tax=Glomus cerebriforme TaxID=658196 RepID=A0A397TJJ1_9GLOM|nr:hypothetical protein C1645_812806 [Glomus cerebriforme]
MSLFFVVLANPLSNTSQINIAEVNNVNETTTVNKKVLNDLHKKTNECTETDIKSFEYIKLLLTGKFSKDFQDVPSNCIHILMKLPLLTITVYNHEPVSSCERDFWNELPKAQIIFKLPDNTDNIKYISKLFSKYMKVEGNKIVLDNNSFQKNSRILHIKSNKAVMKILDPMLENPKDYFYIANSTISAP